MTSIIMHNDKPRKPSANSSSRRLRNNDDTSATPAAAATTKKKYSDDDKNSSNQNQSYCSSLGDKSCCKEAIEKLQRIDEDLIRSLGRIKKEAAEAIEKLQSIHEDFTRRWGRIELLLEKNEFLQALKEMLYILCELQEEIIQNLQTMNEDFGRSLGQMKFRHNLLNQVLLELKAWEEMKFLLRQNVQALQPSEEMKYLCRLLQVTINLLVRLEKMKSRELEKDFHDLCRTFEDMKRHETIKDYDCLVGTIIVCNRDRFREGDRIWAFTQEEVA